MGIFSNWHMKGFCIFFCIQQTKHLRRLLNYLKPVSIEMRASLQKKCGYLNGGCWRRLNKVVRLAHHQYKILAKCLCGSLLKFMVDIA